ncbi:MAG: hypothetical protein FJ096_02360 [Deltaproteobacteria bacterium]|nr:hypothetical protein [Deltaproteobacteria bacterium]
MSKFRYLGEPPRSFVAAYGPTKKIAVPKKDGSKTVLENPTGFPIGGVLPHDFTDQLSLMFLRADTRFQEVTV